MIRTGILLAAGASRRFGPQDKLLAPLDGRPLIHHAADSMRGATLDHRIAVITSDALVPHLAGFTLCRIAPGLQSDSLHAGLRAAAGANRLLIALGDMPDVTAAHLDAVLAHAIDDAPACSHDGARPLPPACFPAAMLPQLMALEGDQGAGRLLADLPPDRMLPAPGLLRDVDRPADLVRRAGGPGGRVSPPGPPRDAT